MNINLSDFATVSMLQPLLFGGKFGSQKLKKFLCRVTILKS